jgi:tyrosyl-tRNA synthetase
VLDRDRTEVRFNSEWLRMEPEALLGLLAQTTVARLLERDDFQRRIAESRPIAALELLYPLLQGYDSVAVQADVEIGGTDQKFNLLFGRDVQVAYGQEPQSILTMPILVGTDGVQKMSKSLGNYVGVTDPPEEMFGRLMSIPDEAMAEYYRLLLGEEQRDGAPAEAKRELARRLVDRFHGEGAGAGAEQRFDQVHVFHGVPDDVEEIDPYPYLGNDARRIHMPKLVGQAFGHSSSEARRLIQQGGVKIDGETLPPDAWDLEPEELEGKVVQVGKRRFLRVRSRG